MCHTWEREGYKVLVGKHEGKRTLGRSRRRQDEIRMDLGGIEWFQLAPDRGR
jgi:hypothetical protein